MGYPPSLRERLLIFIGMNNAFYSDIKTGNAPGSDQFATPAGLAIRTQVLPLFVLCTVTDFFG